MDNILKEIIDIRTNQTITFAEDFYKSTDSKTVMGEVPFKEILFLSYRETEAGSNPREYTGLKKTNLNIIRSLLKDYKNMFRFLHSGIIVSLLDPVVLDRKRIKYDDLCLTNGNQTRFVILILVFLKLLSNDGPLKNVSRAQYEKFINEVSQQDENVRSLIRRIKYSRLTEVSNYLQSNGKYFDSFNKMKLKDFLNSRLRIQLNLLDDITDDLQDGLGTYDAGTLIAEANNDTQKVKVDDIFGNKYKAALNQKLFPKFNSLFKNKIEIEFRLGEISEKKDKVHILTLLRLVLPTGIITKENAIFKLTNQRAPVYNLFERLLKKDNISNTVDAISKLIPVLYQIRDDFVLPLLHDQRRKFIRDYKENAIAGELGNTIIKTEVEQCKNNDRKLEKLIKRNINYNVEHIIPVLIFRIKRLFEEKPGRKVDLTIPKNKRKAFFKGLIEVIYKRYIDMKLGGLPTSLTSAVREKTFYDFGYDAYIAYKNMYKLKETEYITKNSHILT